MYYTNINKKNDWVRIEELHEAARQKIETMNGYPIEQNATPFPIYTKRQNFYTSQKESLDHTSTISKFLEKTTNIPYKIKNASDYYYSQPPILDNKYTFFSNPQSSLIPTIPRLPFK